MQEDAIRALVVFHGAGHGFWPWLCGRLGFRHCFAALNDGRAWIVIDARGDGLHVAADVSAAFDLPGHYRALGFTVIETDLRVSRRRYVLPFAFTCVETAKRALGLKAWWLWTPYQLYRRLKRDKEKDTMGSLFNPPKPKAPPPPPPPPRPDDPAIEAARRRARDAARRRRGRRATILTSGLGDPAVPALQRPHLLG